MTKKRKDDVWRGSYNPPSYFPEGHRIDAVEEGRKGGPKGGRPSKKPYNVDLLKLFANHCKTHESTAEARAALVRQLVADCGVSAATVRAWLRGADI